MNTNRHIITVEGERALAIWQKELRTDMNMLMLQAVSELCVSRDNLLHEYGYTGTMALAELYRMRYIV